MQSQLDGWTSDSGRKYRDFTLRFFIPGTWDLASVVLKVAACGGRGEDIANFLKTVMIDYGLTAGKVVAVTIDMASAEVAGTKLAGLERLNCVNHLLNLSMQVVVYPGKAAKGKKPAKPKSPVHDHITCLQKFVTKLNLSPKLKNALEEERAVMVKMNGLEKTPRLSVRPNNTRWNYLYDMISTSLPLKDAINETLKKHAKEYELAEIDEYTWEVLEQTSKFLQRFAHLSKVFETAKHSVTSEYLGSFLGACLQVFYLHRGDFQQDKREVQEMRELVRKNIGDRLHKSCNHDLLWAGLGLHPEYKAITAPGNLPTHMFAEDGQTGILSFFFPDRTCNNAKNRIISALNNVMKKYNVENDPAPTVQPNDNDGSEKMFFISGFRHAMTNSARPEQEIKTWMEKQVDYLGKDEGRGLLVCLSKFQVDAKDCQSCSCCPSKQLLIRKGMV
jgi:hypothetical protein